MNLTEQLLADGWQQWPNHLKPKIELFAKKFPGHPRCRGNANKDFQVEVYRRHAERIGNINLPESWAVELCGELPDGEWVRMRVEGLNDFDTITRKTHELLSAWDHLFAITSSDECQ